MQYQDTAVPPPPAHAWAGTPALGAYTPLDPQAALNPGAQPFVASTAGHFQQCATSDVCTTVHARVARHAATALRRLSAHTTRQRGVSQSAL